MRRIILIAHNLRSSHNVGSLLRTAEGLGVEKIYFTGYTPYPRLADDKRLPHIAAKLDKQIHKTALGAESSQAWQHADDITPVIKELEQAGFMVAALEQNPEATALPTFEAPAKVAVIVGREVEGLEPEVLASCSVVLEIPMFGTKESYNVVQAAGMALYHIRFSA